MDKQYFFLNGMPRAGNTLLASILNQNPDMQVTANSLTIGLMHKVNDLKNLNNLENDGDTELFLNFPDHTSLDNVIENIIPNYYKNWKYKYIIERSHIGLKYNLSLIQKYLKQPLKVIILMRKIEDVLSSFLKVLKDKEGTDEKKVKNLMRINGPIHNAVLSTQHLQKPEYKDITHFVEYFDLVTRPEQTINNIYKFLDVPYYNHRFINLEQFSANGIKYNEDIDLHKIKTDNLSFTKHELLPKSIIEKYKETECLQ